MTLPPGAAARASPPNPTDAVPALAASQGTQAFADIRHRRRGATTD